MSRADRDSILSDLSARVFATMLEEIVMDTAIQAHKEENRRSKQCKICSTRCGIVHATSATAPVPGSSRAASPPATHDGSQTGNGNGNSGTNKDGNINLDCISCQRPISSNRYAQHLAQCLGVGAGVRRVAQRTAKTKDGATGRSASPYIEDSADDPKTAKSKVKSKVDEEYMGGQKRAGSQSTSPSKKQKKGKNPPAGTGPPRPPGTRLGLPGSNPKLPSKLHSTPTPSVASHVSKNSHSPSAHSDSSEEEGESVGEAESHSSVLGMNSPSLPTSESIGRGRSKSNTITSNLGDVSNGATKAKKVTGTGPPTKKASAPRLPSPKILPPPVTIRRDTTYLVDIEGDETGSDTD